MLCCWILLGESSLAVVHLHACLWGFPSGTSRLSPVDCLRSLSMRIWLFTFRVMQPEASQEDNEQRERWRPQNRFSLAWHQGAFVLFRRNSPQGSVWDLRKTGKPTRKRGGVFSVSSETKQENIELFRTQADDKCYYEKLTHFSWPHIEAQLLLNSRALCHERRSRVWQRLGLFLSFLERWHLY